MRCALAATLLLLLVPAPAGGQQEYFMPQALYLPYRNIPNPANGEGSCVQASLSICGAHHDVPAAESLLRSSSYGPPVLGGSWPERVEEYCRQRNIPIYNIEGSQSVAWVEWACRTGRYAAITYGRAHMITAVGVSDDGQTFYLVDNNTPQRIDRVSRQHFIRQHTSFGGGWCVILKTPPPVPWVPPSFDNWWQK